MHEVIRDVGYYFKLAKNVINLAINHDKWRGYNNESYYYDKNGQYLRFFLKTSNKLEDQIENERNINKLATLITEDILRITEKGLEDIKIECKFHEGSYMFSVESNKKEMSNSFLFSSVVVH